MQPAYIISAYKRPDLLIRLVNSLRGNKIAIHVDRKSKIFDIVNAEIGSIPDVTFLPRHVCYWGLFGHVKASLEGISWFRQTSCDYAILLTGQCYPVKPQHEIAKDLNDLKGRSIIEMSSFPRAEWLQDDGGYNRLDRFYFNAENQSGNRFNPLNRLNFRVGSHGRLRRIKIWTRKPPLNLHPYGGSGYWCLSRNCIDYVLNFINSNPEVVRFFSTTFVPDEMFFQTILANSSCKAELINSTIHYTDWSNGGANPAVLSTDMIQTAVASGAWFARKFEDVNVLDAIDELREKGNKTFPNSPWREKI